MHSRSLETPKGLETSPSAPSNGLQSCRNASSEKYSRVKEPRRPSPVGQIPQPEEMVEIVGLEPTTPALQKRCSPN